MGAKRRIFLFLGMLGLSAAVPVFSERLETPAERYRVLQNQYAQLKARAEKARSELMTLTALGLTPIACDGRLTTLSGTAVPTADQAAATTVYFTPYKGNLITLYSDSLWKLYQFSELSLPLGTLVNNRNYDVFVYANASDTPALERSAAWTNNTTRSQALALQDGVYVKASDPTRRYLGTVRSVSTTQTRDSSVQRYVWNHCNRVPRKLADFDVTNTWATTSTWRQVRALAANRVEVVVGLADSLVHLTMLQLASNTATSVSVATGVGVDSTTVNAAQLFGGFKNPTIATSYQAEFYSYPSVGYHALNWLESSDGTNSVTFIGDNGIARISTGIAGWIEG